MSDTTNNSEAKSSSSQPTLDADSKKERIELLRNEVEQLEEQTSELADELTAAKNRAEEQRQEKKKYKQQLNRLNRENEKLKQSPLFVATVQEKLGDNEILIKQHGNNQEAVSEVTDEQYESLEAETRVAIDNSLNVVKELSNEIDSRVQVMEVDSTPDVNYDDIGGVESQLREVRETVEKPLTNPDAFTAVGIDPPTGVLLHGPPGTGKTMIAKAVANETDATFIQLSGSDLAKKFIGEGAQLVRDLFEIARQKQPAVIFIDEIDAIGNKRTESKTSGDAEIQRTLMQLLSEMDGFSDSGDVSIIGATNRFDMLDEAILRPGRFDRHISVGRPDTDAQEEIFSIHTRKMNVADTVDMRELAELVDDETGAEISSICTEAGMFAIRDDRETVTKTDFEDAIEKLDEAEGTGSDAAANGLPTTETNRAFA